MPSGVMFLNGILGFRLKSFIKLKKKLGKRQASAVSVLKLFLDGVVIKSVGLEAPCGRLLAVP